MKRRPPPAPGPSVNITSLCDIMLSLLIFFMLVSKAGVDTGADPNLNLPLARLGVTEDDVAKEKASGATLVLNVGTGGIAENPRVTGKLFGTGKEFAHNVVNPNTNQPDLREFVQAIKAGRDDFVVAIHADQTTPFFNIQPVLQAVNAARPAQVRFAFDSRRQK